MNEPLDLEVLVARAGDDVPGIGPLRAALEARGLVRGGDGTMTAGEAERTFTIRMRTATEGGLPHEGMEATLAALAQRDRAESLRVLHVRSDDSAYTVFVATGEARILGCMRVQRGGPLWRFRGNVFEECDDAARATLCAELAAQLLRTLRMLERGQAIVQLVDALRGVGHELRRLHGACDCETWGPGDAGPSRPGIVVTFGDDAVTVEWARAGS